MGAARKKRKQKGKEKREEKEKKVISNKMSKSNILPTLNCLGWEYMKD